MFVVFFFKPILAIMLACITHVCCVLLAHPCNIVSKKNAGLLACIAHSPLNPRRAVGTCLHALRRQALHGVADFGGQMRQSLHVDDIPHLRVRPHDPVAHILEQVNAQTARCKRGEKPRRGFDLEQPMMPPQSLDVRDGRGPTRVLVVDCIDVGYRADRPRRHKSHRSAGGSADDFESEEWDHLVGDVCEKRQHTHGRRIRIVRWRGPDGPGKRRSNPPCDRQDGIQLVVEQLRPSPRIDDGARRIQPTLPIADKVVLPLALAARQAVRIPDADDRPKELGGAHRGKLVAERIAIGVGVVRPIPNEPSVQVGGQRVDPVEPVRWRLKPRDDEAGGEADFASFVGVVVGVLQRLELRDAVSRGSSDPTVQVPQLVDDAVVPREVKRSPGGVRSGLSVGRRLVRCERWE